MFCARPTLPVAVCLLIVLGGCTDPPALSSGSSLQGSGRYSEIRPLTDVLATGGEPQVKDGDTIALQARATALDNRAALLADKSLDPATRARLLAALAAKGG